MASDQPDFSGSAMIALYPPPDVVDAIYIENGLPRDELHCTVAYLGDAADVDLESVMAAAVSVAQRRPITGKISGHARFTGGPQDVLVALVDSAPLEQLRRDLVDALADEDVTIPAEHGYTAHITLKYFDPEDPCPLDRMPAAPVEFGRLSVVHGTRRIDVDFKGRPSLESLAREAFAAGWAMSGGPMTERVRAACVAAVDMALEHADNPDILEATLHLGRLEGVWARAFHRREHLEVEQADAVIAAWRAVTDSIDVTATVAAYRRRAGLAETADDDRDAAAQAEALWLLRRLSIDTGSPDYTRLLATLADALKAANAEGAAAAIAIAADEAGVTAIDWDLAFADAYTQDNSTYWPVAVTWLARIVDRIRKDVAAVLAQSVEQGDTPEEMADALRAVIGLSDPSAVELIIQYAMTQALIRGALDLYARLGVSQVNFITAGINTCAVCEGYESQNPWPRDEVPQPPIHIHCRCVISAAIDDFDFTPYLGG